MSSGHRPTASTFVYTISTQVIAGPLPFASQERLAKPSVNQRLTTGQSNSSPLDMQVIHQLRQTFFEAIFIPPMPFSGLGRRITFPCIDL
jgi:hypothetical protein